MHSDSTPLEIPLSQGKVALVSPEDYERVSRFKWHYTTGYAATSQKGTQIYMHRFIVNPAADELVDHKDGDGLNNVRSNLRVCRQCENLRNSRKRSYRGQTSSEYKGVRFLPATDGWDSRVSLDGKRERVGVFSTAEEAARAYDAIAVRLHGEFARLNFPGEPLWTDSEIESRRRKALKTHSRFKGVIQHRTGWRAFLYSKSLAMPYLGTFSTEEEAARAYDAAACIHKGTNAVLNFPRDA